MGKYKTLGETVYEMVKAVRQNSPEFQQLIEFWGREKLLKLYQEEKTKREGYETGSVNTQQGPSGEDHREVDQNQKASKVQGGEANDSSSSGSSDSRPFYDDAREDPWGDLGYK